MRFAIAALSCLGLLACSRSDVETAPDAAPDSAIASAPLSSAPPSAAPAPRRAASFAPDAHLDLSCENSFYAFASGGVTLAEMKADLGASNVVEQSDYDAVWVRLYPGDPAREIQLDMDADKVFSVEARNPASGARLKGVLRVGDDLAAVQRFNGAPLSLDGRQPQVVEVAANEDAPCRYYVELRTDAPGQAAQSPSLRISALRISRRGPY